MSYPNTSSPSPDFSASGIYESDIGPEAAVGGIIDNYTPVNKAGMKNSIGYQLSLIQNFVNKTYLGREDHPVNYAYVDHLWSKDYLYIQGDPVYIRGESFNNRIHVHDGGIDIYATDSTGGANISLGLYATSDADGNISLRANRQIDIIGGYSNSNPSNLNLLNNYSDIRISCYRGEITIWAPEDRIWIQSPKIDLKASGNMYIDNWSKDHNIIVRPERDFNVECRSVNITATKQDYSSINIYSEHETNVRSSGNVTMYAGYQASAGDIDLTAKDSIGLTASDDIDITTEGGEVAIGGFTGVTLDAYDGGISIASAYGGFSVVVGDDIILKTPGSTEMIISSSGIYHNNIPTSPAGLAAGTFYNDGGTLKIVT